MAITIITNGKLPDITFIGTCSNCGCVVSAKREDHTKKANYTPSHRGNAVIHVDCPTEGCGYNIKCSRKKDV